MNLLILTIITVIGIIGIIGTVEYAHAERDYDEIIVRKPTSTNHDCFFDMSNNRIKSFKLTHDKLRIYHKDGSSNLDEFKIAPIHNNTMHIINITNQIGLRMYLQYDDLFTDYSWHSLNFHGDHVDNPRNKYIEFDFEKIKVRDDNRYIKQSKPDNILLKISYEFNYANSYSCDNPYLLVHYKETPDELESKLDNQKDKVNDKIEQKNKWKERYNTCFDKKENFKLEIANITTELNQCNESKSTLETQLNQYKLDNVDNENQCTQLLEDHEIQITRLESNYNLLQQNLTNAEFTIEKLKQEKAQLIKQFEEVETELADAKQRIKELES